MYTISPEALRPIAWLYVFPNGFIYVGMNKIKFPELKIFLTHPNP